MLLEQVVSVSTGTAETSRRTEKIELLAALLRRLTPQEVAIVVPYLSGTTRQGKTGVGYATLRHLTGGPAAQTPTLEITAVDEVLTQLASVQGPGSGVRRQELLSALFRKATEPEQHFLFRLLIGELRQGALEGIMADAIAKAAGVSLASVRRAIMMAGDLAPIAVAALEKGEAGLAPYRMQLFRPIQPMLAQPADAIEEAMITLGEAALEYKMDGARVQVHKSGDNVAIYTRNLNDVTPAVPEVVDLVRALPAREAILDGEVISLGLDNRPNPFQVTMRRFGRRQQVDEMRAELPLTPYWFDLLYLDGTDLLDEPQHRRFAELERLAPAESVIPHSQTADPEAAADFLKQALAQGHEGVMAKAPQAAYAAGARGTGWLKVKQARTLDLVILAAEWGSGRRKGWLSNLHLGARDTAKGGFVMLGKTFKGLTDEMLAWQTGHLLSLEIGRDAHTVFVQPSLVAEIAFNDLQLSSRYPGGLALRFARVKRYRFDKTADHADTFETVRTLAMQALPLSD